MLDDCDSTEIVTQVQTLIDSRRSQPCITLAYAQSLDGCIASCEKETTIISDSHSQLLTHRLRAVHDAILVGVNTVIVDNPQLNVRHIKGKDPRPVIVDTHLRTPLDVRLIRREGPRPIVATSKGACAEKSAKFIASGVEILRMPTMAEGGIDLVALFAHLKERKIGSIMVEGGREIITSILSRGLAHQLVLTISPIILGGVRAFEGSSSDDLKEKPQLKVAHYQHLGKDLTVWGELE